MYVCVCVYIYIYIIIYIYIYIFRKIPLIRPGRIYDQRTNLRWRGGVILRPVATNGKNNVYLIKK